MTAARCGVYLLIFLLIELVVAFADGAGAAETNPLRPLDTSSPRATLQDFIEAIDLLAIFQAKARVALARKSA